MQLFQTYSNISIVTCGGCVSCYKKNKLNLRHLEKYFFFHETQEIAPPKVIVRNFFFEVLV